jgi:hypothetical protein
MDTSNPMVPASAGTSVWRQSLLIILVLGPLLWMFSLEPIAQDAGYHAFADTRSFIGIPNFLDVVSNLPFLLVGVAGLRFSLRAELGTMRNTWMVLFIGVGLVSVGSAYYHWNPTNETLVWDRLPMTVGFMGLFGVLLGEYVSPRLAKPLLFPALALGR